MARKKIFFPGVFSSNRNKFLAGFSLMEMLISMAIFSIITMAVVATFSSVVFSREKTRTIQKNLDSARIALERAGKDMRMSRNLEVCQGTEFDDCVKMFCNSRNVCCSYRLSGSEFQIAEIPGSSPGDCSSADYSAYWKTLAQNVSAANFHVQRTDQTSGSETVGRATVVLKFGSDSFETSVSFRDYVGTVIEYN